jgi:hypothetical protein
MHGLNEIFRRASLHYKVACARHGTAVSGGDLSRIPMVEEER